MKRQCEKCGAHNVWDRVRYLDAAGNVTTYPAAVQFVESRRCLICRHDQALGPANDTPEVLVEIRAAELAAAWRPIGGCAHRMTSDEYNAWVITSCADLPAHHVGYLARCIVEHTNDDVRVAARTARLVDRVFDTHHESLRGVVTP